MHQLDKCFETAYIVLYMIKHMFTFTVKKACNWMQESLNIINKQASSNDVIVQNYFSHITLLQSSPQSSSLPT